LCLRLILNGIELDLRWARTWFENGAMRFPQAIFVLFLFSSSLAKAALTELSLQREVRVRLVKDVEEMNLEIRSPVIYDQKGLRLNRLHDKNVFAVSLTRAPKQGRFHLQIFDSQKVSVLDETEIEFPIQIMGSENKILAKEFLPRRLTISLGDGNVSLISPLSMTDYLLGVLHREMPGTWPMEALKAQAIAARSYTLAQMANRRFEDFDLEGSVLDQDFRYVIAAKKEKPELKNWRAALAETKTFILTDHKGQALKSYYHADCGGRTTVPDLVWGVNETYQSVEDSVCSERKTNRWSYTVSKNALKDLIQESGFEGPLRFQWVPSPKDQRINLVEWKKSEGPWRLISGQNFRQLLGFDKIKSTKFRAQENKESLTFKGQGMGHGVGLCQWGSRAWAQKGWTADQILAHYYPRAKISFWHESAVAKNIEKLVSTESSRPRPPTATLSQAL
jgi:stage II sporulation protein D